MTCRVCGAENGEPHFGGISCKACAAFFRRFVLSRKLKIVCTCKEKNHKSYPCRQCRMLKCMAIGMTRIKVQPMREKNVIKVPTPKFMSTLSLLSCNIIPRSCFNITKTVESWPEIDKKRKDLYGENTYELNFSELSNLAKTDTNLLWNLGEMIFPEVKILNADEKEAIICNFFPRWIIMECAIDYSTNYDYHSQLLKGDGLDRMLVKFYGSSMPDEKRMSDEDILKTFKQYWIHLYLVICEPFFQKKYDKVECIALFLLILFDDAYTNISEKSAQLCRNLRKVVLRELKGYHTDNDFTEMRFLNVISTLTSLERGEQDLQEEVLICGLNNVSLHEDFKAIVQMKKL
ncbi:hypothetical protein GCK72_018028 [Caenorhabditis remanei]|uniref:Nuclear receptor domain-containing protein n=1 Tax=Caenorhabditis remanei TaxID=31234 RepID=A0A6A5G9Z5_CAERE|nr:hypothetical protein GCK72_018028 [Caenorhabditis remanei]KAF1751474.1 hypothetical protein GCK72_018028 [Caenorhabditis remanei]